MNPDELRQAVIDHHLAGNPEAAAAAAAALAAHPQSDWTQDAMPTEVQATQPMPVQMAANDTETTARDSDDEGATTARDADDTGTTEREEAEPEETKYDTSGVGNTLDAALQPFAADASFGLEPKLANALAVGMYAPGSPTWDAIKNIPAALTGNGNGAGERYAQYYDAANEAQEQRYAQLKAAHPAMNILGNTAGFIEGGRLLSDAVPNALKPGEGSAFTVPNMAKNATVGFGVGSEDALVDGIGKEQTPEQRAVNALASGVVGMASGAFVGPAISKGVEALAGSAPGRLVAAGARKLGADIGDVGKMGSGWRKLAGKVGMTADEMQTAVDAQRAAGLTPTIAGALNMKAAGQLNKVATSNPELAEALNAGRTAAQDRTPDAMANAVEQHIQPPASRLLSTVPANAQSDGELRYALKSNTTALMNPIRNKQVPMPQDLLESNEVQTALAGRKWAGIRGKIHDLADPNIAAKTHLNVGELDDIRDQLGNVSPHPGSALDDAKKEVMNEMRTRVPEYNKLMEDYGDADKYRLGFKLGAQNKTTGATTHDPTIAAMHTVHGAAGHLAGTLTYLRNKAAKGVDSAVDVATEASRVGATQRALAAVNAGPGQTGGAIAQQHATLNRGTPQIQVPEEQTGLGSVVRGAAAGSVGMSHTAGHHFGRAIMDFMQRNTFSPEVQREIGAGLTSTNRQIQAQTLSKLRQAGIDTKMLRNLGQKMGAMAGYGVTDKLNRNTP